MEKISKQHLDGVNEVHLQQRILVGEILSPD